MSSSASTSRSSSPVTSKTKNLKRKQKEIAKPESDASSDDPESEDESNDESDEPEVPEEPVLSHAERRRQKKEAKREEKLKAEDGPATKKRKLKDGSAKVVDPSSSAMKRQNSVWVGNMSFKTQQDSLKTFFKDVGEVTRINMPTKAPAGPGVKPENRG